MQPQLHVYKSSAGSGKTTRLAIEYIKLALRYPEAYRHIIALTFTNKAAQEMKERILHYLQQIAELTAAQQPPFFADEILKSLPAYSTLYHSNKGKALDKLQEDAKRLFRALLHHYSDYAVSTLDSFTNRIIRSFSHDLGISFNYQVELDTDELLKMSVDELISHITPENTYLNKVLTTFSHSKIDEEKSRRINTDLQQRAKSLLNDVEERYLQELRTQDLATLFALYPKLKADTHKFEKHISTYGKSFMALCQKHGIEYSMFYQGRSSIYPYFQRLSQGHTEGIVPNKHVIAVIKENKWAAPKCSNPSLIESVAPAIRQIYEELHTYLASNYSDYLLQKQILHSFFPYLVLMELEKILNKIKEENELLHISDFNKIIASKIANESSPYIFERIGNRYHHFLLDEFQDTSAIQWSNLIPLIENALSENYYNLIVGDAKQSIYRWRGSHVEQFIELPALPGDADTALHKLREKLFKHSYQAHVLNTNYRSAQCIIDFNNSLFAHILQSFPLSNKIKEVYAEVAQIGRGEDNPQAFVQLTSIDLSGFRHKSHMIEAYNNETLSIIKECRHNNYRYKDIAVLCRNNKDIMALSAACLAHNIPFVSSESLEVTQLDTIPFVLSFIQYLQYDKEIIYQAELLQYLHKHAYFDAQDAPTLAHLLTHLNSQQALQPIWQRLGITVDKQALMGLDAYEGIARIAQLFQLPITHPFFHFFMEAALSFSREHHQGLTAFPPWWQKHSKDFKLELPEDKDAVRLMTFHKAKGLEFPIVINWFSDRLSSSSLFREMVWLNPMLQDYPEIKSFPFKLKDLEHTRYAPVLSHEKEMLQLDQLNLFYVALTRPSVGMYILSDAAPTSKQKKNTGDKGLSYGAMLHSFVATHYPDSSTAPQLIIGQKQANAPATQDDKANNVGMEATHSSPSWRQLVGLQIEEEKMWQLSLPIQSGIKIHKLLAQIHSEADISTALNGMLYNSLIEAEEYEPLMQTLKNIVNHPSLHSYFSGQWPDFNEIEICQADGSISRPDKMIFTDTHCVLIDYKTGKERPEHLQQLQHYMRLASAYSQKTPKGFLVYIDNDIVVKRVGSGKFESGKFES